MGEHLIKTNNRQFTSHSVTHGIKKWASNKILDLGEHQTIFEGMLTIISVQGACQKTSSAMLILRFEVVHPEVNLGPEGELAIKEPQVSLEHPNKIHSINSIEAGVVIILIIALLAVDH